jgi:hypothetical protein
MKKNDHPKKQVLIYLTEDTANKIEDLRFEMRFKYKTDIFEAMAAEFIERHSP